MCSTFARLSALVAAVAVTAATLPADEPAAPADAATTQRFTLRYKFAADQVLHYEVQNASSIDIQVGQVADSVNHETTSTKRYRVTSTDPANVAELEVTIVRVQLAANNQGQQIIWDSDSTEPAPEAFQGLRETIGKPLGTVQLSPLGKVIDVEMAAVGVGAVQTKESHLDVLPLLPEQPVAVGETWKEEFSIDAVIKDPPFKKPIQMQRLYTLRSVEDGIATIDEQTFVLTPIRDPELEGQLIQRTPAGTCTVDLERGLLVKRELKIDKRVVGFQGPNTALHVQGTREDRYVPEEQLVRQSEGGTATK
jgi:hypothetical protein